MKDLRYSGIDLLRFLAAYTVAITHISINQFQSGINFEIISSMAVEVFFIISGFVLAPQIISLVKKNTLFNYKIFLIRRWYRTIPLYILSLIITTIILDKFTTFDFLKYTLFLQNFFFIWVKNDYFSISWSLSVEEWFYIIFPFFLISLFRIFNSQENRILLISFIFVFLIFLIRVYFSDFNNWGSSVRRVVIFRLDSIAFGFILFCYKDKFFFKKNRILSVFIIFLILSVLTFYFFKLNIFGDNIYIKLFSHYLIAFWGCSLFIFFYILESFLNNDKFRKLNLFLGKISYSTYLFHLILIYIIGSLINTSFLTFLILFTFLQIILSIILYYFFEEPILKSRPNYK